MLSSFKYIEPSVEIEDACNCAVDSVLWLSLSKQENGIWPRDGTSKICFCVVVIYSNLYKKHPEKPSRGVESVRASNNQWPFDIIKGRGLKSSCALIWQKNLKIFFCNVFCSCTD